MAHSLFPSRSKWTALILVVVCASSLRARAQEPRGDETRLRQAWEIRRDTGVPVLLTLAGFISTAVHTGVGIFFMTGDAERRTIGRFHIGVGITTLATPLSVLLLRRDRAALPEEPLTEYQLGYYEGILANEATQARRARWVRTIFGVGAFLGNGIAFSLVLADDPSERIPEASFFASAMVVGIFGFVMSLLRSDPEKLWDSYRAGEELAGRRSSVAVRVDAQGLSLVF